MSVYQAVRVETEEKQDQYFRFGQDFTDENIQVAINRKGYAHLLTYGVVEEALKGFDIVTPDGDPVDWGDDILEIIRRDWKHVIKGGKYERGFGKSILQVVADKDGDLHIRSYRPKQYDSKYDRIGNIRKLRIRAITADGDSFEYDTDSEDEPLDLDFVHEIRLRPTDVIGQSRSYIEPVWDQCWGLDTLDEQGVFYAVKFGSGLIFYYIPAEKLKQSSVANAAKKQVQSVGGMRAILIPLFEDYADQPEVQPKIEQLQATQIDFLAIRDLLIGSISAVTGIPREVLLGSELGLRSAETNQSAYFSFLETIQKDYEPIMKWLVETIASTMEGIPEEDFEIDWHVREAQDEEKETNVMSTKVDIAIKLLNQGFTKESVLNLVGLTELEMEQVEEAVDQPQLDTLNNGDVDLPLMEIPQDA